MQDITVAGLWLASVAISLFPFAAAARAIFFRRRLRWLLAIFVFALVLGLAYVFLPDVHALTGGFLVLTVFLLVPISPLAIILGTSLVGVAYLVKSVRMHDRNAMLISMFSFASLGMMLAVCLKLGRFTLPQPSLVGM